LKGRGLASRPGTSLAFRAPRATNQRALRLPSDALKRSEARHRRSAVAPHTSAQRGSLLLPRGCSTRLAFRSRCYRQAKALTHPSVPCRASRATVVFAKLNSLLLEARRSRTRVRHLRFRHWVRGCRLLPLR
jgi:hypothetical protein